jgi:transposase
MTVETLGIDIAKNVFQLHGVNHHGCVVLKRRVMRDQLLDIVAQVERCTIVVEACTGAFCWARKFEALGHQVKIISSQYVKPFVRRQKNDGNDAEAICTAARQPHIPLVPKKTVEQQDIQALHRSRQRRSIIAPPWSAKSEVSCSIEASPLPRALPAPGDWFRRSCRIWRTN